MEQRQRRDLRKRASAAPRSSAEITSPSIMRSMAGMLPMATAIGGNRFVQFRPLRVHSDTRPRNCLHAIAVKFDFVDVLVAARWPRLQRCELRLDEPRVLGGL